MPAIYFTEQSIGFLAQCILSLIITLYLFSKGNKSRQLWWLIGYAAGMSVFSAIDVLETSLYQIYAYPLLLCDLVSPTLILLCLLQFAYSFPNPSTRLHAEARWVFWLSLLASIAIGADVVRRIYQFQLSDHVNTFVFPYLLVLGLEFLWSIIVLLRQTVALSSHSGPRWRALLRPQGKPARMAHAFALLHALPLGIVLTAALREILIAPSLVVMFRIIGMLCFLLGTVIVYFNYVPEPASMMVRLIGISLTANLAILGVIGVLIATPLSEFYSNTRGKIQPRTFRFEPDKDGGFLVAEQPFSFETATGGQLKLDDDDEQLIPLPFAFPFYDRSRTQIYVNSDGAISFERPLSQTIFRFDYRRHTAILPMMADFNPSLGGKIWVHSEPQRILITWEHIPDYNAPERRSTIQLVLYANGTIEMTHDTINIVGAYRPFDHREALLVGLLPGKRDVSPDVIDFSSDLPYRAKAAGGLFQDYQAGFRRYLHQYYGRLAIMIVGASLLIVGGFPIFFYLNTIKPLYSLTASVKQVNDGDLSIEAPQFFHDEIGFLTASFNGMISELRNLVANLEERVKERTQQLEDRNTQLALQADALRRTRREADSAREKAEVANQAKSDFLANMTHELRSPLNAILGFAQVMNRSKRLDSENTEYLRTIMRSGEHLLGLIDQVLDLSKIEAKRMSLEAMDFDLNSLLHDLEDMFRLKADEKHLQLRFERDPRAPRALRADELKLRQVLINLLNNAIKFTEQGGITVKISLIDHCELAIGTCQLHFEISDSGPGIAPEEADKLFEAFEQTSSGRQSREGTGLGLAISHSFVQLMGGELQVESRQGKGACFHFVIPCECLGDDRGTFVQTGTRRVPILGPELPHYRILVVDDQAQNRLLLRKLLEPLGVELQEAENGRAALQVWEEWRPHLIWMDLQMSVMNGYEAARSIRHTERTGKADKTTIIAITASIQKDDRAKALAGGFDDLLRKPFREQALLDMMIQYLDLPTQSEEDLISAASERDQVDMPAALAELPAELLQDMEDATKRSDIDLIEQLIEKVRAYHVTTADVLADLSHDFHYERILQLLEETKQRG